MSVKLGLTEPSLLDIRASLCLLDPEKSKDPGYTHHRSFIDQNTLADVLNDQMADFQSIIDQCVIH